MATEILESLGDLQHELEQAKSSLKGVDENIKRLIGRDPSEIPPRPNLKRPAPNEDKGRPEGRLGPNKFVRRTFENVEPPNRRRNPSGVSVFNRLSDRPVHESSSQGNSRQLISKVIVTPKEIPSRQEALEAQSKDVKYRERNRRMFGALLGTLQKFQQEETKLKKREEKREKIEKKIEEHEIKEKEEIKKERQELFMNRRKKQAEIKMIELKMLRMKEYTAWENRQNPRKNFILTKTKPHIQYIPKKLNDTTKQLLEKSKAEVEKLIEKRKETVTEDLKAIEERMKRNLEGRFFKNKDQEKPEGEQENHKRRHGDDEDHDHSDEDNDGDALMSELPAHSDNDENKEKTEENGTAETQPTVKSDDSGSKEETPMDEEMIKNIEVPAESSEERTEKSEEPMQVDARAQDTAEDVQQPLEKTNNENYTNDEVSGEQSENANV